VRRYINMWSRVCDVSSSNLFFFSSRRRHTRSKRDWSSDVCSSDLQPKAPGEIGCAELYQAKEELRIRELAFSSAVNLIASAIGKIGRASCRERVGGSSVAMSLKKKKEKIQHDAIAHTRRPTIMKT